MFGLFKMAAYALLGYALYEFFRGLLSDVDQSRPFERRQGSLQSSASTWEGDGSMTAEPRQADGGAPKHQSGHEAIPQH